MAELIGLFLIIVCGAVMLNPNSEVPDDKQNLDLLVRKYKNMRGDK